MRDYVEETEILFFFILFQTERDGVCNDFSSLEVKGSHRKMTERIHFTLLYARKYKEM